MSAEATPRSPDRTWLETSRPENAAAAGDRSINSLELASDAAKSADLHVIKPTEEALEKKSIAVTDPPSPLELATTETALTITLDVKPATEVVSAAIASGDEGGTLEGSSAGSYLYTRGASATADVTLHFELESDATVFADLHVTKPAN